MLPLKSISEGEQNFLDVSSLTGWLEELGYRQLPEGSWHSPEMPMTCILIGKQTAFLKDCTFPPCQNR